MFLILRTYIVFCILSYLLHTFFMQVKELNHEPNEFEVFKKTHTRKYDQGQKMWIDNRSNGVAVIVFMYIIKI